MLMTNVVAELCIYILTWNVGTHHPHHDTELTDALGLNGTSKCPYQQLPDLFVIGLQEVSVEAKNQFLNIFQDDPWIMKFKEKLDLHQYVKIETEQMQGLLVMLFAQPHHVPHMEHIATEHTGTGLGGFWGNKGAVSIRLSLYGTGVTFVVAHLAAHDEGLQERINDYNQIVNKHHYDEPNYRTIFDHDFVFWFGDLNFRLSTTDSAWDVREQVEQGRYEELLQKDQLLLVRDTGNAFALLKEQMLPDFAPTFKFVEGSNEYNLKRRPAWCDRILSRVQEDKYPNITLRLKQLSYNSHPNYTLSDHKPVSAEFLYIIEAESQTDRDLHAMTHSGSRGEGIPLASVIIFSYAAMLVAKQYAFT